jgi:hypothetical protein
MGLGKGRTRFLLFHRYTVDGCESDRTASQLPPTSCSTDRKVPSSLKLFFQCGRHQPMAKRLISSRGGAYPRISSNKLGRDGLASCERRPCRYINQQVPKVMADARLVEDHTGLSTAAATTGVNGIKSNWGKNDVPALISHQMSGREEPDRTAAALPSSHCQPSVTPGWYTCQCTRREYLQLNVSYGQ